VTERVLGTTVHTVAGDGDALIVSDLHVPEDGGPVVDHLAAVLELAAARRTRVFVLGDLFDSYVSPAQLRVGVWQQVAALCRQATARGAELTVLHGNRDFLLGAEFERATGGLVVPGGIRTRLGGRDALLLHGDELCVNDLPYQRAKRWLRSLPVRALARSLPLGVALRLAARARRRSQRVIATGDPARFLPTAGAVGAAFALGVELLVFGHIHRASHGVPPGHGRGEYWVLPAFDRDGVALRCAANALHLCRFRPGAATPLEPPPPLPLPAG
jgi:UDP-2,3-diacylglucosamine hydrolase